MTIIEFLSLGLVPGKKYNVTLKTSFDKKPVTETLFFKGFRFYYGRSHGDREEDIIPVFNEMTKNGKMSPRHYTARSTWTEYIVSVTDPEAEKDPTQEPIRVLSFKEADSMYLTVRNIENNAWRQLMTLLHEMGRLFPGRDIQISDDVAPGAVFYYKHGCAACTITRAIPNDGGTPAFYLVDEYLDEAANWDQIEPTSWAFLLSAVMDAIRHPFFPDDEDKKTFIDMDASWKDIPLDKVEDTLVLKETRLLDSLAADLWFKRLTEKQKKETFKPFDKTPEQIDKEWDTEWDDAQKTILFHSATKK